jgi:hypothetical protein
MNYEQAERFLRTYSAAAGPFDANGLLHLILAGIDNLRENAIEQELDDYSCAISDEQAAFLTTLLKRRFKNPT